MSTTPLADVIESICAERDRARDLAVRLEQENAQLRVLVRSYIALTQATAKIMLVTIGVES